MTPRELDKIFPFVVLGYGLLMTLILNLSPWFQNYENRFTPYMRSRWAAARTLGPIFLVVGAAWSLQSLWFSNL